MFDWNNKLLAYSAGYRQVFMTCERVLGHGSSGMTEPLKKMNEKPDLL